MTFNHSYREIYDRYLSQFKNKHANEMLDNKYDFVKAYLAELEHELNCSLRGTTAKTKKRKESELVGMDNTKTNKLHKGSLDIGNAEFLGITEKIDTKSMREEVKSLNHSDKDDASVKAYSEPH